MLPRSYRLPSSTRLGRSSRYHSPLFIMKSNPNKVGHARFTVIVGKKVDKRAVKRNSIRRLFQAGFLTLLPEIQQGVDILCIVSPSASDLTMETLLKELRIAFGRQHLIS